MFLEYRRSGARCVFAFASGELIAIRTRMFFLCAQTRRAIHRRERERDSLDLLFETQLFQFQAKRRPDSAGSTTRAQA